MGKQHYLLACMGRWQLYRTDFSWPPPNRDSVHRSPWKSNRRNLKFYTPPEKCISRSLAKFQLSPIWFSCISVSLLLRKSAIFDQKLKKSKIDFLVKNRTFSQQEWHRNPWRSNRRKLKIFLGSGNTIFWRCLKFQLSAIGFSWISMTRVPIGGGQKKSLWYNCHRPIAFPSCNSKFVVYRKHLGLGNN